MLVTLASACAPGEPASEPTFALDATLACPRDVIGLEGGLHAHLLASTDGGRTFDYAPDRPLEARVTGTYDLVTGAFAWVRTYVDGYRLASEKVVGQGTAYTSGDLDVAFDQQVDLRDGSRVARHVRLQRDGCASERVESTPEGKVLGIEVGSWGKRGEATTTDVLRDGAKVTLDGLWAWSGVRTEHEAWRVDDHELVADRTDDGEGHLDVTFREVRDGTVREGAVTTQPDGREQHVFTETGTGYTADWRYHVDLAGDGAGTRVVHPDQGDDVTCDVSVTNGTCRVACPGADKVGC